MDPIVVAAGSAVVSAMATEAWGRARSAVTGAWRRVRPDQADAVGTDLARVRDQVLEARRGGDEDTEQALIGNWRLRLQELVRENPAFHDELRRLVQDELLPVLPAGERSRVGAIFMSAKAEGHGRVYQAGRDQHITES
ncbi:hypothetical protein [Embleya hyalina]|uniref:Uncharacterized protein n=1 Tax=Embleya hyalina TaxID=516124 RepID=A0A401YF59_9ACTN|nr:hypothetical protein [Embleya hyalina]GCD93207.1 hypothetical protein EHYA_00850 [Embleya hyalina]